MRTIHLCTLFAGLLGIGLAISSCSELQPYIDQFNKSVSSGMDNVDSGGTPLNAPRTDAPVRVTMNTFRDIPDANNIYWDIKESINRNPEVVFRIDDILGDFEALFIQLHEADEDGKEKPKPWAINDAGKDTKVFLPNRPFMLGKPGDVNIISPDGEMVDRVTLKPGKTYIALFVVQGSKESHTHKVRFKIH